MNNKYIKSFLDGLKEVKVLPPVDGTIHMEIPFAEMLAEEIKNKADVIRCGNCVRYKTMRCPFNRFGCFNPSSDFYCAFGKEEEKL